MARIWYEMLGNDTVGESGNASINALEDVGISEVMSFFVTVDVSAVDMDVVDGTIVDFKLEKSNIGEAKSDAIEVSSISLSFSIALVSSESSLGACISYGFSSPLISPKIIHNNIIWCQHISQSLFNGIKNIYFWNGFSFLISSKIFEQ